MSLVLHAKNILKEGFVLYWNHLGISLRHIILSRPLFEAG